MEQAVTSGHISISTGRQPAVVPRNTETDFSRSTGAEGASKPSALAKEDLRPRHFRGADGRARLRLFLYLRDAGQCQYCGIELRWGATWELEQNGAEFDEDGTELVQDFAQFDQIVPRRHRGRATPENMVVACGICKRLKGNAQIPEHLRPDASGDYEEWWRNWAGRSPFDADRAVLCEPGLDHEEEYEWSLSDDLRPYRPDHASY